VADSNFDIWRLQAQADVRGLIEAVRSGTPDIRKRATTAIRALGASSAIPALQSILVSEQDAEMRSLLISTLDYLFEQEIDEDSDQSAEQHKRLVHLIAQLNSDKPDQVISAAQRLGEMRDKIAAESLVMIFHNRKIRADVRLAAAEALIKLESAPIEVTLLGALRHSDWHHRRNAAAVLGQLHADWAVQPLIDALRDEQEIVRRTAYAALKRIGTPEALKAIEAPEVVKPPTLAEAKAVTRPLTPRPLPASPVDEVKSPPRPLTPQTPPAIAVIEKSAPIDDDDTQPSAPTELSDDVG
jgi:HEAT repeat protein